MAFGEGQLRQEHVLVRRELVRDLLVSPLGPTEIIQLPQQVALLQPGVKDQIALRVAGHQPFDQPVGILVGGILAEALGAERRLVQGKRGVTAVRIRIGELREQALGLDNHVARHVVVRLRDVRVDRRVGFRKIGAQVLQQLQPRRSRGGLGLARIQQGLRLQEDAGAGHIGLESRGELPDGRRLQQRIDQPDRLGRRAGFKGQARLQPRHADEQVRGERGGPGLAEEPRHPFERGRRPAVHLERPREVPLGLPAAHRINAGRPRRVVEQCLRGIQPLQVGFRRIDLRQHALEQQHARGHGPRGFALGRPVGVGGVAIVPGAKIGVGHEHAELRPGVARRQFGSQLRRVVGGRAVAPQLPGHAGEHAQRLRPQLRPRKTLQQRLRIFFRAAVVLLEERRLRPIDQQFLLDRMRDRRRDQLVEFLPEPRAGRASVAAPGQELQRGPLRFPADRPVEQPEQRIAPHPAVRAGDQAEQQPHVIRLLPFLGRQGLELALQERHGLGLAAQGIEGHGIVPRINVA